VSRPARSLLLALASALPACAAEAPNPGPAADWQRVVQAERAALLSVHGTDAGDVWTVGADDGDGPLVLHFDGRIWTRKATGASGDLWWVNATPGEPVFFAGSQALFLRYEAGAFERIATPGDETYTAFGVWAAASDDVYLVGAIAGQSGFIWHYDGTSVTDLELPGDLPRASDGSTPGLFKVWGRRPDDVWVVGTQGVVLRGSSDGGFALVQSGGNDTLFTVHENAGTLAIVGGSSSGVIYEADAETLEDVTPAGAPLLQGVSVANDGTVWAVGYAGSVYRGRAGSFEPIDTGLDFGAAESLHSAWADPEGGVWAVGGDVLTPKLDQGLAVHLGKPVPSVTVAPP
jgi:hypothetical protein